MNQPVSQVSPEAQTPQNPIVFFYRLKAYGRQTGELISILSSTVLRPIIRLHIVAFFILAIIYAIPIYSWLAGGNIPSNAPAILHQRVEIFSELAFIIWSDGHYAQCMFFVLLVTSVCSGFKMLGFRL